MARLTATVALAAAATLAAASVVRQDAPASVAPAPAAGGAANTGGAQPTQPTQAPEQTQPAQPAPADGAKPADGDKPADGKKPPADGAKKGAKGAKPDAKTDASADESADESPDASAAASPDDDGVCFPAGATVEMRDGSIVAMKDVAVGDEVRVGIDEFSRVFMFTHKMADTVNRFVSLKAGGAELELTPGHYLYVNGALAAAETVVVGDTVTLAEGGAATVEEVASVRREGLYNPQTVSGNVVVNGVLASTYTTAVEPSFAHAILAPFRALSNVGLSFTALESGGGALTQAAPKGAAVF